LAEVVASRLAQLPSKEKARHINVQPLGTLANGGAAVKETRDVVHE
jgi:hypothetical protein